VVNGQGLSDASTLTCRDAADVSVVVVSFHSADDLPGCVGSLIEAGIKRGEIIVVDNASRDESVKVARELGVTVVENRHNDGFAKAVNRGARIASGQWLLVLNPDTRFYSGALGTLLETAASVAAPGVIGPRIITPDGEEYPTGRRFPSLLEGAGHALLSSIWRNNPATRRYHSPGAGTIGSWKAVDWVSGACMLMRKDAFEHVGCMDEGYFMYGEDMDLCLQMTKAGRTNILEPNARLLHLGGRSSRLVPFRSIVRHHRSTLYFYHKRYRGGYKDLLTPVVGLLLAIRAGLILLRLAIVRLRTQKGLTKPR
jgi:N-acetylglucosaminyl-diphospho-decaprenol L-rhamnosyltransferase